VVVEKVVAEVKVTLTLAVLAYGNGNISSDWGFILWLL
jgi:hypothetical protein